jgi:hypothetical protein
MSQCDETAGSTTRLPIVTVSLIETILEFEYAFYGVDFMKLNVTFSSDLHTARISDRRERIHFDGLCHWVASRAASVERRRRPDIAMAIAR